MPPRKAGERKFHNNNNDYTSYLKEEVEGQNLTHDDAELILQFLTERSTTTTVKPDGQMQIARVLTLSSHYCHGYRTATLMDVYSIINWIKTGSHQKETPFLPSTQRSYIWIIKAFFTWLIDNEISTIPLRKISQVKKPSGGQKTISAADLLTSEDITAILKSCKSSRNRAIISMLYEGGS